MNISGKWLLIPRGAQWVPVELSGESLVGTGPQQIQLCRLIHGGVTQTSQGLVLPGEHAETPLLLALLGHLQLFRIRNPKAAQYLSFFTAA